MEIIGASQLPGRRAQEAKEPCALMSCLWVSEACREL